MTDDRHLPPGRIRPIVYRGDERTFYDVDSPRAYAADPAIANATLADLSYLVASPHWQDRVRAEVLRRAVRVTMPDQFPCLYESDARADRKPIVWVASPDIAMLEALLPDYQALWDSHTDQWGPSHRRTFAVGLLDGVAATGIQRPGTTPEEVLVHTMVVHEMYGRAPERLKALHPHHERWTAERAEGRR